MLLRIAATQVLQNNGWRTETKVDVRVTGVLQLVHIRFFAARWDVLRGARRRRSHACYPRALSGAAALSLVTVTQQLPVSSIVRRT